MFTSTGLTALCSRLFVVVLLASPCAHAMRPQHKTSDSAKADYKLAVVSASYGDRGFTNALPTPPPGVLCVLYTNKPIAPAECNGWTVVQTPYHDQVQERWPELYAHGPYSDAQGLKPASDRLRNTLKAKFYKMSMHVLPEVQGIDVLMWVDADYLHSWQHNANLADTILELVEGKDIVIEKHPYRAHVLSEASAASATAWKVSGLPQSKGGMFPALARAVKHQKDEGFLDDQGLFMCAIFVLNARSSLAQLFMKSWYQEVQLYVYRDQISFPFLCWKLTPAIQVMPVDALGNLLQDGAVTATLPNGRHRQDWNKLQSRTLQEQWQHAHRSKQ
mmetsp:Transcript_50287/g.92949  ORF Transcript_50287/g.92949 Transcript_50287/m.92949 type:complete len:333 (-) Transcript_50287:64-1062(-)